MNTTSISLIDYFAVKNKKGTFVLSTLKNKTKKVYQIIVKPIKKFNHNKNETKFSFE